MTKFVDTLWYQITSTAYAVAYTRGQTKEMKRFAKEIAESVISNFPNAPHLFALEQMMDVRDVQPDLWRDVLTMIDQLLEAKNGGRVEGDISRREGEPHEAQQELCDADDSNAWRPSTPSGVDESAL